MLVDLADDRSRSTANILRSIGCELVGTANPKHDLLDQIERVEPDVVIIDIELPDRDMLENLRNAQNAAPRPMVMFSQDDDGYSIRRAIEAGVSAYVADGIQAQRVRPILDAAIATFDQYQLLQKQLDVTRNELDKRTKVDRAKRILMKQRDIYEQEAYELLRSSAMQQQLKIEQIAQKIIDASELLGGF